MGLKPELGQTVYLIYRTSITVEIVYALGEKSFIRSGFDDASYLPNEYFFDKCGVRWFTELDKAKEFLINKFKDEPGEKRFIQDHTDYYELEFYDS